jgi:hypothetical protein
VCWGGGGAGWGACWGQGCGALCVRVGRGGGKQRRGEGGGRSGMVVVNAVAVRLPLELEGALVIGRVGQVG